MSPTITHTPVYVLDLDQALHFYTDLLGFETHVDVPAGPDMRWLTLTGPGARHELLLASVDQHIPASDRAAMREVVAKGNLAVFIEVDDLGTGCSSHCGPTTWRSCKNPSTSLTASATAGYVTPAVTTCG